MHRKKVLFIISILFVILFLAFYIYEICTKKNQTESIANETTNTASSDETASQPSDTESMNRIKEEKSISDYTNCAAQIIDSFQIAENAEFFPCAAATYEFVYYPARIQDIYQCGYIENMVVGEVLDIVYYDKATFPYTIYSFAVTDVLKGMDIEKESIITVVETQGYRRLSRAEEIYAKSGYSPYSQFSAEEKEQNYEVFTFAGEPLVAVGDHYVLSLSGKMYNEEIMKGYYFDASKLAFMGKYIENDEGKYERYISEGMRIERVMEYYDPVTKEQYLEGPKTLEELKEALFLNGLNPSPKR
ncbi:MAG: hypothetical protein PUF12_06560 [Thermoflexaceae bacterium]|nr:hypothetical protein [Thermoflexaceae bacterium]